MRKPRTITMSEIETMAKEGISTFDRKDNSVRGREIVAASKIKPGDKVLIGNYFTTVIA